MSVARKIMANLLQHYEGALVGALVGDCLGAPFEFSLDKKDIETRMKEILKFFRKVDSKKLDYECEYTDDTAMLRSVAESLIECKKFDAENLSRRFTDEFFKEPKRGYGANIPIVFRELKKTKFQDPFGPAAKQFDGRGSHGNGGAMRIAPAALFGLQFDESEFNTLVKDITRLTHANRNAINGATLESTAVQLALRSTLSSEPFTPGHILEQLSARMQRIESSDEQQQPSEEQPEQPYGEKLEKIKEYLQQNAEPDVDTVVEELGNDVSALRSVPAAVYSFLRTFDRTPEEWETKFNAFQRTIIYAISLGGDTDTIASMAGAIAGAYHGISGIPDEWKNVCEGLSDAKTQARKLHDLAEQRTEAVESSHL